MCEGRIRVWVGTMYSGKTTALLEYVMMRGDKTQAFKPAQDTRDDRDTIFARGGIGISATRVAHAGEILEFVDEGTEVVVVDEAFMLPGIVSVAQILRRKGLEVCLASIALKWDGTPFRNVAELLCYADHVVVCDEAKCTCGARASYNRALLPMEEDIVPGDGERYAPQCARCFVKPLPGVSDG